MVTTKPKRLLIRCLLIVAALGCFIEACKFLDAALPYVWEISGNPYPSEAAELLGPAMMRNAKVWFVGGLICSAILIATLFIKVPADRSPDK